jgi:hypothetical protein
MRSYVDAVCPHVTVIRGTRRIRGSSLKEVRSFESRADDDVVTVMFDLEYFTEASAFQWWEQNKSRICHAGEFSCYNSFSATDVDKWQISSLLVNI